MAHVGHARRTSPPAQRTLSCTEAGRPISQRETTLPALLITELPVTLAVAAVEVLNRPVSFQVNWPVRPETLPRLRWVPRSVAEMRPPRTRTIGLASTDEAHTSCSAPPLHL